MHFAHDRVITDPHMTERVLYARSPARAARRMKKGYPQHYITRPRSEVIFYKDEAMIMHPTVWEQLKLQYPHAKEMGEHIANNPILTSTGQFFMGSALLKRPVSPFNYYSP